MNITIKKYWLLCILLSTSVFAEPWVDTSNIFLRADIQLLADQGHINTPTTTYPIMWAELSRSLKLADKSQFNQAAKNAYWHIQQQLKRATSNRQSLALNIASDDKRYTSFGDEYRDDSSFRGEFSVMGKYWAGKLAVSAVNDAEDDDNVRLDGSYIAAYWGNWVASAGMYDRWMGPGWDTNLALTNNARPMPGVAITRKTAEPFVMPFFNSIQIPWSATAFMNQFEDHRAVPNALLFGVRANFRLSQNLEIGGTRLIQWAGDDRPSGLSTFWDAFVGTDLCAQGEIGGCGGENRLKNEPGNQQGGYDIRYHLGWLPQPISLYMQMMAEDGNSNANKLFGQKVYSYGIDTRMNMFSKHWLAYLEFTDTYTDCTNPDRPSLGEVGLGDCFSEHYIYESGMRYERRMIGHIYENDSKSFVLGFISQLDTLQSWEVKFRYLELNRDNSDKYPNDEHLGNTLTKGAEDVVNVSVKYQKRQGKFKFTLGTELMHSSFEAKELDNTTEPSMYFNIEYAL